MAQVRTALAAVLVWVAAGAGAQSLPPLPPPPERYFNDYAALVDAQAAARLEEKLRRFDQETSSQVVVAVFPELPWPSLEDFTVRTAQSWRVGRRKLDNGAVLFVFAKDRQVRLEVGYGLEGALPDALAKRIIEERIVPAFREGRYAEGLESAVDAVIAATRGEYTAPARRPERRTSNANVILALVVALLLVNALLGRRMARGRYVTYHRRGRRSGWGGPWYWGGGGFGGGGGGGGFGGGGFSGGGGSFGGGGASGRW